MRSYNWFQRIWGRGMPGTVSLALLPALTLLFDTINHDGNPYICNCIKLTEYDICG